MAKYHINKNNEAKPCNAKKRKCPFGGESGEENHFSSLEEASLMAAKIQNSKTDLFSSHSKTKKSESNAQEADEITIILNSKSKRSVKKMKEKGYDIHTTDKLSEISTNSGNSIFDISEVDILDTPKLSNPFDDLMAQYGHPFLK